MNLNCDVLVVGCGPAGASAARAAAMRGVKVICIERKREIGIPVQCAEGIGTYLLPHMPFRIPKKYLSWKIEGIKFWVDGKSLVRSGEMWGGYTIDRGKFEKWLTARAKKAGSKVFVGTELLSLKVKNGIVKEALARKNNKRFRIKLKVLVAADGSESKVLSIFGRYKKTKMNVAEVYSWEMHGLSLDNPHFEQIYVGDFAPGGYGYIFPKSKTSANVGVGASTHCGAIKDYFKRFLDVPEIKKQVTGGLRKIEKTKKAVWGDVTDELIFGNVVAAGDAANHNLKPFIEGILPSVISGDIAGEIAQTLSRGEVATDKHYLEKIRKRLHPHFDLSKDVYEKCNLLFKMKHKKKHLLFAGLAAQLFKLEEIEELKILDYEILEAKIIEESAKNKND